MSQSKELARIVNEALEDGRISDTEAEYILKVYYSYREQNEQELMEILRQYGVSVSGLPKPTHSGLPKPTHGTRNSTKHGLFYEVEGWLVNAGDLVLGKTAPMSPKQKQKLTWLSIVGPAVVACLIHLL
jgi:hypothetical protein